MNIARKIESQNLKVIRGERGTDKRLDRLFALTLVLIGLISTLFEHDLTFLIITLFISLPLTFSKKRFTEL